MPASAAPRFAAAMALALVALAACSQARTAAPSRSAGPGTAVSFSPNPSPSRSPRAALTGPATPGASSSGAPARTISAIQPRNTPNGIPDATNGRLDPSLLMAVDADCLAYLPAATGLGHLFTLARASGVSLGANRCYRPLDIQTADRSTACTSGNCACAAKGGTSMHGWGEAADFKDDSGSVNTFTSATYAWLVQVAGRFGWNHPGWAVPGGSPCPEPWHWEWVGDGGTLHARPIKADVVALLATPGGRGYRVVTGLGAATPHGDARSAPAPAGLDRLVVAGSGVPGDPDPADGWLVTAGGTVLTEGAAPGYGSVSPPLPVGGTAIVAMAPTPSGRGYWLLAASGRLFPFGDAAALRTPPAAPRSYVGVAASATGRGAWLASSDGQVTALGDAAPLGSASVAMRSDPVMAMAGTPSGRGYWVATAAGRMFAFGDAGAPGPAPLDPGEPVVAMTASPSGAGCWLVTAGGEVYARAGAASFGNG